MVVLENSIYFLNIKFLLKNISTAFKNNSGNIKQKKKDVERKKAINTNSEN